MRLLRSLLHVGVGSNTFQHVVYQAADYLPLFVGVGLYGSLDPAVAVSYSCQGLTGMCHACLCSGLQHVCMHYRCMLHHISCPFPLFPQDYFS